MDIESTSSTVSDNGKTQEAERYYRRNAFAIFLFDFLWCLGMPCCMLMAVIPMYLLYLGCSKTLVQAITTAISLFVFMQLFGSRVCSGPRRKWKNYLVWLVHSCSWTVYAIAALMCWSLFPVWVWVTVFSLMVFVLGATMHLGTPTYGELVVENIPREKRGSVITYRQVGLGVGGLIGIMLVPQIMKHWSGPTNYHVRFLAGSIIYLLSCSSMLLLHDQAASRQSRVAENHLGINTFKELYRNFNFRSFFLFYMILLAGLALCPLLIGYGKDVLLQTQSQQENFILAYFVGNIIIGLLIPRLADQFGFRLVAIIASVFAVSAFMMPVTFPNSSTMLFVAYSVFGGASSLTGHVLANFGAELLQGVRPANIIAVGGTMAAPLSLGIAPFGGLMVDIHGRAGYIATFMMGATFCVCALLGFLFITREPRTGQEIFVRIRRY